MGSRDVYAYMLLNVNIVSYKTMRKSLQSNVLNAAK